MLRNDYYISGRVSFTEKAWSISFELHDTNTGELVSVSKAFKARSRTKLFDAIEPLVVPMVRDGLGLTVVSLNKFITVNGVKKLVKEPRLIRELPLDDGLVRVLFDPSVGSNLYVDGQLECPRTPCFLRLPPGIHTARFEASRYSPASVEFEAEDELSVEPTLTPRFGWINVEMMDGLHVVVDGNFVEFPLAWQEVDEGKIISIAVADNPCYRSSSEQVTIKGGERKTVKLEVKPKLSSLKINAFDEKGKSAKSSVNVDGKVVGKTGETLNVPLCSKILTVPINEYIFGTKLQMKEGNLTVITAKAAATVKKGAMVMLPGGSYSMEYTNREVSVDPFLLDVTEVTTGAYRSCVWFGNCTKPIHETRQASFERFLNKFAFGEGSDIPIFYGCTYYESGKGNYPINCVNWDQANAYCSWVGKRLPTEEEWEWAARGADRRTKYPWGNEEPTYDHTCRQGDQGNNDTNELRKQRGFSQTCAVGAYPLGDSPQGIKDLEGNVSEWTSSKPIDKFESSDTELRVYRGGFWGVTGSTSEYIDAVWKRVGTPIDPYAPGRSELPNRARNSIGFRCAKTP